MPRSPVHTHFYFMHLSVALSFNDNYLNEEPIYSLFDRDVKCAFKYSVRLAPTVPLPRLLGDGFLMSSVTFFFHY